MLLRLPALLALALLPVVACGGGEPPGPDPLVEIAGPKAFLRLELRDYQERVIWRLVAAEPAPLDRLIYGQLPAGFRQEVPADGGPPRSLEPGEPLTLDSLTPRREFLHEGFALDGQRMAIERWAMKPRRPPGTATEQMGPLDDPAAEP